MAASSNHALYVDAKHGNIDAERRGDQIVKFTPLFAMSFIPLLLGGGIGLAQPADDPLLRPIAADYAKRWLQPHAPAKIFGNAYLVGFGALNVGLIDTGAGLILIDGALPQAVPAIEDNIRRLGFDIRDIKFILSTEPHYDHASGMAALARDSGATVVSSVEAAPVLRSGKGNLDKMDPQAAHLDSFPGIARLRTIRDGEAIKLGNVIVTARATPGHTQGSMSWTWQSCEGEQCANVVFASSLNPASAAGYRFSDPANAHVVALYRKGFARMRALPCDILLTAHPDQSGGDIKLAALQNGGKPNPFFDPVACRTYADKFAAILDGKLSREKSE